MRTKHDEPTVAAMSSSPKTGTPVRTPALQCGLALPERGVALILVMLSMLILTMLAATIVFTARAETFASANYKLDTQADYLAKAGIQRAINWFRSSHYQAVTHPNSNTYYQVTATGDPFNLYISGVPGSATITASPVQCKAGASTACSDTSSSNRVQLIGYGSGSSNYPDINNTESTPRKVIAAFTADLNNSSPDTSTNRITADSADSGFFNINATLLSYETVILSPPLPATLATNCVMVGTKAYCAVETWMITSKGTWTGVSSSGSAIATAEEIAIIQPIFWPTSGNALYGYCSVTMNGSSGVCTDAFNSSLGAYGGGNVGVAAGACDSSSTNVISTGAGVGSNGGVTLAGGVTVGGNVTLGSQPSAGCTATPGCSGCDASNVLGEVINGPPVPQPATPTFPVGFPNLLPNSAKINMSGGNTYVPETLPTPFNPPSASPPAAPSVSYCFTGGVCNGVPYPGSATDPYLISEIKITGGTLTLLGGSSPLNPIYYDIGCIDESGNGIIKISGYVVLNVQGGSTCTGSNGISLNGNGIANSLSSGLPPEAVQINYAGSTKGILLSGNGAISAVISAPLAHVQASGCGANGYIEGSIQANNINMGGGCPVHYDVNLARVGGTLGNMVTTAYGRKKM